MLTKDNVETVESVLWGCEHNDSSLEGFRKLYIRNKEKLVDYIESFPMYELLEVNGTKYILTHAGFDYDKFDEKKNLDDCNWNETLWSETDYDKVYFKERL